MSEHLHHLDKRLVGDPRPYRPNRLANLTTTADELHGPQNSALAFYQDPICYKL